MTRAASALPDDACSDRLGSLRRLVISLLIGFAQGESPRTDRECEVLAAAAGHDAAADIAGRLHLSLGTVRNHLSAAIQKLGARNRAEAVQIAQQQGWL